MIIFNEKFQKLSGEKEKLKKEFKSRAYGYIVGGFGFVAALAWNDAIIALINEFFPKTSNTLIAKFVYAIIITIVVVVVATNLMRFFGDEENK